MPDGYRLVSFVDAHQKPQAGVVIDGRVIKAGDILGTQYASVIDILRNWDEAHPRLARAAAGANSASLADLKLLAPLLYPGALFCAGANYWDHLQEMAEIAKRVRPADAG